MGHFLADGATRQRPRLLHDPVRSFPVLFALAVVALLSIPSLGSSNAAPGSASSGNDLVALASPSGPVTSTFGLNFSAIHLSSVFWGTTVTPRAHLLPLEGSIINATPTQAIVWPGGYAGDDYNPITNTIYSVNRTTHIVRSQAPSTSEAEFAVWCRSINCSTILQVPGEIDNASLAAQIVNYTEKTLGLYPKYWEIGNEPERWSHWGLPWNQWGQTGFTINPVQYAWEVRNYTLALKQADPSIKIIGIPATGRPNGPWPLTDWVNATVTVNARNISGVAFHDYPAGATGRRLHPSLASFYGVLNGPPGLTQRVDSVRNSTAATLQKVCPNCTPIPVFVTEVGSALAHWAFAPYSIGFPGALDMAAQMTQAMSLNVTNQDLFAAVSNTSNSWFNLTGSPRPDYIAYSQILNHLGPEAFQVSLTGFNHTLFAIATTAAGDHNRQDLLVVNVNVTSNVTFAPAFAGAGNASPTEIWQWNGTVHNTVANSSTWVTPQTSTPVPQPVSNGLPGTFTIPAQSLVLFESYPANATPVRFVASGLPNGARWFVDVAGKQGASTNLSQTFFLPPGTYSVSAPAIPLPLAVFEPGSRERLEPFVGPTVSVGQTPVVVPVPFAYQWRLNISAEPTQGGTIIPAPAWANATQPLALTAVPYDGYHFSHWFGWWPGSYNGTANPALVTPNGPLTERAIFVGEYPVAFNEIGLPNATTWSVTLRTTVHSSSNSTITFDAANGTYGFDVTNVSGYRTHPPAGSVNVTGAPVQVPITFQKLTPPGTRYNVTFAETGLPAGTNWSVAIQNNSSFSTTGNITFREINGTHGYDVGPVLGYRAHPPAGAVNVTGGPARVSIVFQKLTPPGTRYNVTFVESGLPAGTNWSVMMRNVTITTTTSNLTFREANGTSGFDVENVSGFRAHPSAGSVNVIGAPVQVAIAFQKLTPPGARFAVSFAETGLPTGTNWSVAVRNVSTFSSTATITFQETNGTSGFEVGNVSGYRAHPPAGSVNVTGAAVQVPIVFQRVTPPGQLYPVTFVEVGLPVGTGWSIIVRNESVASFTPFLTFVETNGSFGYRVGIVGGYRMAAPNLGFVVRGGPTTVAVPFGPNVYAVVWNETGLWKGVPWDVSVNGVQYNSTGSWVTAKLPNGSYPCRAEDSRDWVAHPGKQLVTVSGADRFVSLNFTRAKFAVTFFERGLPANVSWSVRFSDQNLSPSIEASAIGAATQAPNGSYTYDVVAPSGYYPDPSHGVFTVYAGPSSITIDFVPNHLPPIPSVWVLGPKAVYVAAVLALATWGGYALLARILRSSGRPGADR